MILYYIIQPTSTTNMSEQNILIHNELMDILRCLFRFEYTNGTGNLNQFTSRYCEDFLDIRKDDFWENTMQNTLFREFYYRGNFWEYYHRRGYQLTISKEEYIQYFKEQSAANDLITARAAVNNELLAREGPLTAISDYESITGEPKKLIYHYMGNVYKREIGIFLIYNYDSEFKRELREWAESEFLEEFMVIPK